MRVTLPLVMGNEKGDEETVTDVITLNKKGSEYERSRYVVHNISVPMIRTGDLPGARRGHTLYRSSSGAPLPVEYGCVTGTYRNKGARRVDAAG